MSILRRSAGATAGDRRPATADPSLTSDMVLVHKVFRRELRLLADLIAEVKVGDRQRAAVLAAHYRELASALRHHHDAERDLLWQRLALRAPLSTVVQQNLLSWHRRHAELMSELESLLPMWQETADPDLRAVLADIAIDLAGAVAAHLDAVEAHVLPAVEENFSSAEWLRLGLRAAAWIPLHRMARMLGAMLEDATPAERANLMGKVPAPARLLYAMVGQEQYEREMRTLRGSPAAA